MSGLELLSRLKELNNPLSLILVAERPSTRIVVGAIHGGASAFLDMPLKEDDLWLAICEGIKANERQIEIQNERSSLRSRFGLCPAAKWKCSKASAEASRIRKSQVNWTLAYVPSKLGDAES